MAENDSKKENGNGSDIPSVYKVKEVAHALRVHASTVYRLIRTGELKKLPVGNRLFRIRPEDLQTYLETNAGKTLTKKQ